MRHKLPSRLSRLDFDPLTRAKILEWYAERVWVATEEGSGEPEYGGKSYDPLRIELRADGSGVAHSYVFGFHDGGRHHSFDSLDDLEDWLLEEAIEGVDWARESGQEPGEDVARSA